MRKPDFTHGNFPSSEAEQLYFIPKSVVFVPIRRDIKQVMLYNRKRVQGSSFGGLHCGNKIHYDHRYRAGHI